MKTSRKGFNGISPGMYFLESLNFEWEVLLVAVWRELGESRSLSEASVFFYPW